MMRHKALPSAAGCVFSTSSGKDVVLVALLESAFSLIHRETFSQVC